MWIVINYLINKTNDTNKVIMIGFFTWLILSIIFYTISSKYLPK